jgi:hypothetical protein
LHIILFASIAAFLSSASAKPPLPSIFEERDQSNSQRSVQDGSTTATKAPVPAPAAQIESEKLVHEVFQREYADRSDPGRRSLAEKLLAQAPQTEDLAERYVLLRESATAAASAGDLYAADLAVDHIAANFQTAAYSERLLAYQQLAARPDTRAGLVEACFGIVDAAMSAEDFRAADQFLQLMATVNKPSVAEVAAKVATIRGELASRRELADKVNAALETLKVHPDDRQALAFVGRHYCLAQGDWLRGLPMLAASDDESLNLVAQAELHAAGNPAAQLEVANPWWDLRQRYKGRERTELSRHCATLYSELSPRLTGLRRTLAEKRLAEMQETNAVTTKNESPTGLSASVRSVAYLCDASGSMMGLPFDLGPYVNHTTFARDRPLRDHLHAKTVVGNKSIAVVARRTLLARCLVRGWQDNCAQLLAGGPP